ncbi:MAG: anthranilate phosphoribosyltransferase [Acidobacteria bacterium]|nr:anthranilate phosphoribosyltransferase [Acidobacteriota bacterium]
MQTLLDRALSNPLERNDARALMQSLLAGELAEDEMRMLLVGINARGFHAAEFAGFAEAMRAASVVLPFTTAEREELVDTCGTGGDSSGSFNISTAVALTAAACGVKIAKHGNRSVTSKCGSADVLEALGIPTSLPAEAAAEAIRTHNFAFLMAPIMHPAMKVVGPTRKAIGVRTVFNVLGPMTNPAGAAGQVMGVYSADLVPLVAEALAMLRVRHAMVVHGDGGLDELSLSGPSQVAVVRECGYTIITITPEDAGLQRASLSELAGADAEENAAILRTIFDGEKSPKRDIVLLNTAAVLLVAGLADDLRSGVQRAAEALDSGAVTRLVSLLATK